MIWIGLILALLLLVFVILLLCIYHKTFFGTVKMQCEDDELFEAHLYSQYQEHVTKHVNIVKQFPFEEVSIISRDGIKLVGKYYEFVQGAPIILLFHGFRGSAFRDGNGGLQYAKKIGYNALLVDQRAHGKSEGKTITFGVKEQYDCLDWINYVNQRFSEETPIYLMGMSMGASTILLASGHDELPSNVKAVLADCGYSSAKGIIREVIKLEKYPMALTYFLVTVCTKICGFDLEDANVIKALQNSKVPTLIIHGDADDFVPPYMAKENYDAIPGEKTLAMIKDGGHGMSYCVNPKAYEEALDKLLYIK